MGTLTHKAARAAYGTAIDAVLKHVKKDREKGLLELVDLTEKYMGDNFQKENYFKFIIFKSLKIIAYLVSITKKGTDPKNSTINNLNEPANMANISANIKPSPV